MSDTPDPATAGKDTRDGGQGPTDIPEETVASESELSLSQQVEDREKEKGE